MNETRNFIGERRECLEDGSSLAVDFTEGIAPKRIAGWTVAANGRVAKRRGRILSYGGICNSAVQLIC